MYTSSVRKKRVWRRLSLGLLSLVLATVSVIVPLSQTTLAEAGVASVATYKDDTIRRSLAEAMTECISGLAYEDGGTSKTAEDIARGDWGNTQKTPYVGPLADSTDGRLDCNKEVPRKTKDYFGYASYIDMYCDLGGIPAYGSGSCKDAGSGDIMRITGSKGSSVISVLEKKLGKKLPKDDPTLDYALAFGSLTAKDYGCRAEPRTNLSADDLKRSDNHKVTVAMTDGTTKEVYYYIPSNRQNDDIQMFASGFTRWAGKPKLKCSDLVNWTSRNAAAYATQVKKDVSSETEDKIRTALLEMCTSGGTGGTITEYCNTQVNQWLAKCKSQIPTSGAVGESSTFVKCIENASGKDEAAIKAALANVSVAEPAADEQQTEEDTVACAISGVGWIVCPTVNFLAGVADMAFDFLADNFLSVPTGFFDTSSTTYTAWKTFVSIANAAFVIVFLIMIYSQITGGGWSNYALKKLLPRLIIAAILVNLSFIICALAADLSNTLGYWLKSFLSGLAGASTSSSAGTYTDWSTGANFAGIAGTVLAGSAVAAGGVAASGGITLALVALLGILVPGLIALIMIFLILMVRQVIIVLLIVIAPLAFVAFLLPNTESLFKKWQKLFTSMLLLFPIIGLIYGASSLASGIITAAYANSPDDTMELGNIIGAGVMILPLFVVPSVLKKSIDAVGSLGGKISGIGAKLSGGAQKRVTDSKFAKFQQGKLADKKARIAAGTYRARGGKFNPSNWRSAINRGVNRNAAFNAATGGYGAERDLAAQAQNRKDMQETIAMFGNDDGLVKAWAQTGGDIEKARASGTLNEAQLSQFQSMRSAGHHRKDSSFIAAASYLSENGKGSSSDVIDALKNARAAGADDVAIEGAWQSSVANYRKSGRGDVLGEMAAHYAANGNKPPVQPGARLENNANTMNTSRQRAWSEIDPGNVHREALATPGGRNSFQAHLAASQNNLEQALRGFDRMEARAKTQASGLIISAAQARDTANTGTTSTIASIEDAKKAFTAP